MQNEEPQETLQPQKQSVISSRKTRKLRHSPKKILLIILSLVAISALGYGVYWYNQSYGRTMARDANEVIERLSRTVPNGVVSTTGGGSLPPYQPSGSTFAVRPTSASMIVFKVTSDKLYDVYQKIRPVFDLKSLTEKPIPDGKTGAVPDSYFENAYVHCSLITLQPDSNLSLQITCANNDAYSSAAQQTKLFHDLFTANNPSVTGNVAVDQVSTHDSKTNGYKTAEAIMLYDTDTGAGPVWYYQTPDSTWHYFRDSPVTPYCKEFSTTDLKKAYLGEQCYTDALAAATVTL